MYIRAIARPDRTHVRVEIIQDGGRPVEGTVILASPADAEALASITDFPPGVARTDRSAELGSDDASTP